MFENLVESTSHKDDLARKGSFILGTIAVYAVFLTGAAIASIMFFEAQLDSQNLELTTLVAPVPIPPQAQPDKNEEAAKPTKATTDQAVDTRRELMADTDRPDLVPKEVATKSSNVAVMRKGVTTVLGGSDSNAASTGGPIGTGGGVPGGGGPSTGNVVQMDEPPPQPTPKPKPPAVISGGVLTGKAVSKPQPAYPPIAKSARAQGTVTVQILVDESGKVVSASAVSGHPLLRAAAVQAAYRARFSPTLLSGQPVKVSGTITYNFTLQ
ncbi:MAG: energy transducer TonB [Pyrinomonadaceae bacterium]|nr:energy transducer TonB [Pyrinomonadaceae bacterium]